jgi:hypothetical protein
VRAVVVERVLRRDDEERLGQRCVTAVDGHARFAHRLEQRRLHLRARAVDLVGEHDVREQRAGLEAERAGRQARVGLGQRAADQVRGQEIARELDAPERRVDAARERVRERGLAHARARPRAAGARPRSASRPRGRTTSGLPRSAGPRHRTAAAPARSPASSEAVARRRPPGGLRGHGGRFGRSG